jgi:ring-1,2-phenylacetyl-CoA epoxidase subunit PaaC
MISNTVLQDFLTEWAEDEFWVGHMLTKKIYEYGPDLEENVAIGSISQDEIGHCRMLLSLFTTSEKEMDHLIYGKQPEQIRVSRLAEYWYDYDWASLVMKQLIYDASDSVRLTFARLIPDSEFQNVLDMMKREENIHLEHWMEWALLIAQDDNGKQYLQKAVDQIYPLLSDFFADPLYDRIAQEYGLNPVSTETLLTQTMDMLNSRLEQIALKIPLAESAMIGNLTVKGGRYGLHSANFEEFYNEYTSVYRLNPDMIWG